MKKREDPFVLNILSTAAIVTVAICIPNNLHASDVTAMSYIGFSAAVIGLVANLIILVRRYI